MNQILSTEDINNKNKKSKNGNKNIKSIIKFFAIVLIVFAVGICGFASYSMIQNSSSNNKSKDSSKPEIQISNKSEEQIIVTIMGETGIKEVKYYWNDEEEVETVNGDGRKYIQLKLQIPKGENTIIIKVTDENGEISEYSQTYTLQKEIDITMKQAGNNIKINVTGNETISKVEYKWDKDEAKTKEVNEKEYSFEVDASLGEHELTVKATDVKGNEEEKKIKVTGTTKPTVDIDKGDNCYKITAHDDVALDRIEIETLADGKVTKMQPDGKDFEYDYPLKEGDDNYIKVTAYNTKGVASKSQKAVWKK